MYKILGLDTGKQNLCPFPHKDNKTGKNYYEKNESCGINEKGQFNCFVCKRSFTNEDWFTASYLNVSLKQAEKFNEMLKNTRIFLPSKTKWKKHQERLWEEITNDESDIREYLKELNVLDIVVEARLGLYENHVTIPTFYKGQIINICQFCPGEVPKYRNSASAITGVITTTKLFDQRKEEILICAGEKDMLLATKYGFNAISILGGEKVKPIFFKNLFKSKKVYIAYDNDSAGIEGALSLAEWLYRYTKDIKVLNVSDTYEEDGKDLVAVAKEDKEDLTDFFNKYNQNEHDLRNVIDNCRWYQPPALENQSVIKLIHEANKVLKELEKKVKEIQEDIENGKKNEKK